MIKFRIYNTEEIKISEDQEEYWKETNPEEFSFYVENDLYDAKSNKLKAAAGLGLVIPDDDDDPEIDDGATGSDTGH